MRTPSLGLISAWLPRLSLFVCGMIVGAAVFNGIYHYNFNQLVTVNTLLKLELQNMQEDIEKLSTYKDKQTVIKTIRIIIEKPLDREDELDQLTEEKLKQRIHADLAVFIGEDIYEIAADSRKARLLLHNKRYTGVNDGEYSIDIRTMLAVSGTLQVWVSANLIRVTN